jgi:hypothetical protein
MFRRIALALLLALAPGMAAAMPMAWTFSGTFTQDDEVQLFALNLPGPALVTLRTTSYAGGIDALGGTVPRGGFDPILAVFDSAGMLLAQNDNGGADVPADALTGATFDSFLLLVLAAGDYTLALGQFDNLALGPTLADGFERGGQGAFTTGFGCPDAQPSFNDVSGVAGCGRTGAFAVDVLAEIPEPASAALLLAPALALGLRRRR